MSEVDKDAIIELYDDDDNVLEFEHLLTFEYGDELFVAFTPIVDMEDFNVGDVLIMRVKQGTGMEDDTYLPIETEQELNELWEVFQELYYEDDELDDQEDEGESD